MRRFILGTFKKLGISLLAAPLTFGLLTPAVIASPLGNELAEQQEIQITSTETVVSKNDLIQRFKEIFPNQFDDLTPNDFHMYGGHRYPDDERIRYDLSFFKTVNGKQIHGGVVFVGENFEVENFYYEPADQKDALYPAKVSKEEAEKIAVEFVGKFLNLQDYQLTADTMNYYPNQTLTEPIRYHFSFTRVKNGVEVSDQRADVTVLGNGEVVNFYRYASPGKSNSFDDIGSIKDEESIVEKIKESLTLQLQYQIDYDYRTGQTKAQLVYKPTSQFAGVHALTGDWQTATEFSSSLPEDTYKVTPISDKPLDSKQDGITLEEAKATAEELLAIDSDLVTLSIDSMDETDYPNGQQVINVHYMYQYQNGGTGTTLTFDKQTGEIIQYHDIKSEVLAQIGEKEEPDSKITRDEALKLAVDYLKEFSPSNLHQYSMPIAEATYFDERGYHHFFFPRLLNGIPVSGDELSVTIGADGSLNSLNIYKQDIKDWPSIQGVISAEEAMEKYLEDLGVELQYVKVGDNRDHYYLVYVPEYEDEVYNVLDAKSGEWLNPLDEEEETTEFTHPWAAEELNYLLNANVLEVDNVATFDADQAVTKGKALEIIIKSLTYIYPGDVPTHDGVEPTFANVGPDHPLYQVVERAVIMGILDDENENFDVNAPLTREELAVWFIRALNLDDAAEYSEIYQLDVADEASITPKNKGHVALATSIGLLTTSQNKFNPEKEVSYAELAVSTIRLAHHAHEKGINIYY